MCLLFLFEETPMSIRIVRFLRTVCEMFLLCSLNNQVLTHMLQSSTLSLLTLYFNQRIVPSPFEKFMSDQRCSRVCPDLYFLLDELFSTRGHTCESVLPFISHHTLFQKQLLKQSKNNVQVVCVTTKMHLVVQRNTRRYRTSPRNFHITKNVQAVLLSILIPKPFVR